MEANQPLRIALSGYGRMGREVEKVAHAIGHEIVCIVNQSEDWEKELPALKQAQVVIDFSEPSCAAENIGRCFDLHLPVVVGTTGWDASREALKARCMQEGQTLMEASNFSIGVYLFMATARFLAERMNAQPQYAASIEETHHIHKLDKPSGTAITLAKEVCGQMERYEDWKSLPITSFREGEVVGIHTLTFDSEVDTVTLRHEAKSRRSFAAGAVRAAEWLVSACTDGRKGWFGMKDMMGF